MCHIWKSFLCLFFPLLLIAILFCFKSTPKSIEITQWYKGGRRAAMDENVFRQGVRKRRGGGGPSARETPASPRWARITTAEHNRTHAAWETSSKSFNINSRTLKSCSWICWTRASVHCPHQVSFRSFTLIRLVSLVFFIAPVYFKSSVIKL